MYKYYFEKLDVWQISIDFCSVIYKLTETFPTEEKYGLVSQLRRAAVSVPTNIAEGISRETYKDQARFSTIAYGSLMEVLNLLIIAQNLKLIEHKKYLETRKEIDEISNKLNSLKKTQKSLAEKKKRN